MQDTLPENGSKRKPRARVSKRWRKKTPPPAGKRISHVARAERVHIKVPGKRSADIFVRQQQSAQDKALPKLQDRNVLPPLSRQDKASAIEPS